MAQEHHRGAKVGTRVAMLVSKAIVHTHKRLIGAKHKLAMMVFHSISNEISREVDGTLGKILVDISGKYPDDGPARPLLDFLVTQEGQLKALLGTSLTQGGLLWVISAILNNELAPVVYDTLRHTPRSVPDAGTIAQIAAQGTEPYDAAVNDIAAAGLNAGWADSMITLAQQWPQVATVLDMRNRELIDDNVAKTYLKRAALPDETINQVLDTRIQPLSPADAALAVLRGEMSKGDGARAAAESGITSKTFDVLVGNTGEPLALMQLLEAYRRNFIDRDRLVKGILQSRVRDEWVDVAEKLRYAPMSIADAVNAVVQNHIDTSVAERIAEENGLQPGQLATLIETAGEPLSRTEMSELVNRGQATIAEFEQALRESRLKNKYTGKAVELRRRLLEPRMLAEAVQSGVVGHDYALRVAMDYGYDKTDAEILVSRGSATKLKTYKDRVVAAVEALYEDDAINEDMARKVIESLGYTGEEVSFILEAASFHAESRTVTSAISALRSKYLGRHVTEAQVKGYLDALGVSAAQRDSLLKKWQVDVAANVRQLSEAQVAKAVKLELITEDEGFKRLVAMGYSATDAGLLLAGA